MQTDKRVSKPTASAVIGLAIVVVSSASAYAVQDGSETSAAADVAPPAEAALVENGDRDDPSTEAGVDATSEPETDDTLALVTAILADAPMEKMNDEPVLPRDPSVSLPKDGPEVVRLLGNGRASFYGYRFAGRPTANGEPFDPMAMTAAHRTLPFGTRVRVTNRTNGRWVVVRINDRGPFAYGRSIDLSRGAAEKLDMIRIGIAPVKIEVVR